MTPVPSYIYRAIVAEVHDGDTVTLDVDLGFFVHARQPCRVLGINAAELGTPSGTLALQKMMELLPVGTAVTIRSVKPDKYGGRFLGDIYLLDGRRPADLLIAAHLAVAWDGQGVKPVPS